MKVHQVSLRGTTYAKLKAEAERRDERISEFVSRWIEEDLDRREGLRPFKTAPKKVPKAGHVPEISNEEIRGAGYHEF